jgi:hypothetical protein
MSPPSSPESVVLPTLYEFLRLPAQTSSNWALEVSFPHDCAHREWEAHLLLAWQMDVRRHSFSYPSLLSFHTTPTLTTQNMMVSLKILLTTSDRAWQELPLKSSPFYGLASSSPFWMVKMMSVSSIARLIPRSPPEMRSDASCLRWRRLGWSAGLEHKTSWKGENLWLAPPPWTSLNTRANLFHKNLQRREEANCEFWKQMITFLSTATVPRAVWLRLGINIVLGTYRST